MRKFWAYSGKHSEVLSQQRLREILDKGKQPVSFDDFYSESAKIRDLIARAYDEIARLGSRVYQLERQMAEWREHLL